MTTRTQITAGKFVLADPTADRPIRKDLETDYAYPLMPGETVTLVTEETVDIDRFPDYQVAGHAFQPHIGLVSIEVDRAGSDGHITIQLSNLSNNVVGLVRGLPLGYLLT